MDDAIEGEGMDDDIGAALNKIQNAIDCTTELENMRSGGHLERNSSVEIDMSSYSVEISDDEDDFSGLLHDEGMSSHFAE